MTPIKEWLQGDKDKGKVGILKQKGLSVEWLGRKSNLSRMSIYHYMNGECVPTYDSLTRICKTLGVPLEEALKYTDAVEATGRPTVGRRK
jgi:transcriptional regulator with XRE-family HTH domain